MMNISSIYFEAIAKLGIISLLLVLLIMIFILHLASSKKYYFFRDGIDVHLIVTKYFLGLMPTTQKKYYNVVDSKIDKKQRGENFVYKQTNITLNQNEDTFTKSLFNRSNKELYELSDEVQYFLKNRTQNEITIHKGRFLGLFVGIFAFPFVGSAVGTAMYYFLTPEFIKSLESPQVQTTESLDSLPAQTNSSLNDLSNFPQDIPIPHNAQSKQITFDEQNQRWNVTYVLTKTDQTPEKKLRDDFRLKGWQTSNIKNLSQKLNNDTGRFIQVFDFGFRKKVGGETGGVIIMQTKNGSWHVTLQYPE